MCSTKGNQMAECGIIYFLGLFYKSANICFYGACTQIKANLLQFRLSSWLKWVVACTVTRPKKSLFIYHHKKTISQTYEKKKKTAPFKCVVKSVLLSVIIVLPWSYAKHLVLCGYWNASDNINHQLFWHSNHEYGNIWFCVERETQHLFRFRFSLK